MTYDDGLVVVGGAEVLLMDEVDSLDVEGEALVDPDDPLPDVGLTRP